LLPHQALLPNADANDAKWPLDLFIKNTAAIALGLMIGKLHLYFIY